MKIKTYLWTCVCTQILEDIAHVISKKVCENQETIVNLVVLSSYILQWNNNGRPSWIPPEIGEVKIMTNSAINSIDVVGWVVGVPRSDHSFFGAWSKPYVRVSDPLTMEALSLCDFAYKSSRILEGDDWERLRGVVNLWQSREASWSIIGLLLGEIRELVSYFSYFYIHHVIRSANLPAHLSAKYACLSKVPGGGWIILQASWSASCWLIIGMPLLNKSSQFPCKKSLWKYPRQILCSIIGIGKVKKQEHAFSYTG